MCVLAVQASSGAGAGDPHAARRPSSAQAASSAAGRQGEAAGSTCVLAKRVPILTQSNAASSTGKEALLHAQAL